MEKSLSEVLDAAGKLIEQFDYQDRAEIIDFDSNVVTGQTFTGDKTAMHEALKGITVGGGTALYDAIAAAFDHLKKKEGMKTVLVLSDGEDENSVTYTFDKLKERLKNEGVRVFTIALGEGVDTDTMTQIAELTEGTFYHAAGAEDVEGIYQTVITYLHSLHRFWYSTSYGMFDGSEHSVTVRHHESDTKQSISYEAPEGEYWSHTIFARKGRPAIPFAISPDGEYVSQIQYRVLLNSEGRRLNYSRWNDCYGGILTNKYICGWVHRAYGFLDRYDRETGKVETVEQIITDDTSGNFHTDWVWFPKAISRNDKYLLMCADPGDDFEYNYYFMLYDREEDTALWEQGFYNSDFDEPGAIAVANDGTAAITQERNLFLVEPDGDLRFSLLWKETGHFWSRLSMSSDGGLLLGRDAADDVVWLYSGAGNLLWEKPSECNEQGGYLAVSPNGKYVGFADLEGPHVYDPEGSLLFELETPYFEPYPNGIDIANDGTFVYSLGNRMYYRKLEE
jgi:hypothetical protein